MVIDAVLAIDLGTSTCRAALVSSQGEILAQAASELQLQHPAPLAAEIEPEHWWQAMRAVIGQVLATCRQEGRRVSLRGVGLSGLMHAPVLLDAEARAVVPAPLWFDQRAADTIPGLREKAERAGIALPRLGTSLTLVKLAWLAKAQPAALARARHLLLPKDYLRFRLTGVLGTDETDAEGTGLWGGQEAGWREDMAALVGFDPTLLPPVSRPTDLGGTVTPAAAAMTGLPAGVPVAVGASDAFCTKLGAGLLPPRAVLLYLGTAAWLAAVGDDGASFHDLGATATTGGAVRWLAELFTGGTGARPDYPALLREAEAVPAGSDGLLFLPHLMGERGPEEDPHAHAAFLGLTLRHRRGHLVRAVLEGLAFQLRHLLDSAPVPLAPLHAVGGLARSPLFLSILAEVTRRPVLAATDVEAGQRGAAVLAGVVGGVWSLDGGRRALAVSFHPAASPSAPDVYGAPYATYLQYDATMVKMHTPFGGVLEPDGEQKE